jgi:hypothetical protein
MDIGQAIVSPATGVKRVDPLAITAGYAMFHSSFTTKVEHYARKYGVDVRDVIVKLTSEDRVNAPDELLERICQELVDTRIPRVITVPSIQIQRKHFPDAGPLERNSPEEVLSDQHCCRRSTHGRDAGVGEYPGQRRAHYRVCDRE